MNIYEPMKGVSIYEAVKEAKAQFIKEGYFKDGKIKFNDLLIPFHIDSNETDIVIIYSLMAENNRLKR